jgi:hypothetical protein
MGHGIEKASCASIDSDDEEVSETLFALCPAALITLPTGWSPIARYANLDFSNSISLWGRMKPATAVFWSRP